MPLLNFFCIAILFLLFLSRKKPYGCSFFHVCLTSSLLLMTSGFLCRSCRLASYGALSQHVHMCHLHSHGCVLVPKQKLWTITPIGAGSFLFCLPLLQASVSHPQMSIWRTDTNLDRKYQRSRILKRNKCRNYWRPVAKN